MGLLDKSQACRFAIPHSFHSHLQLRVEGTWDYALGVDKRRADSPFRTRVPSTRSCASSSFPPLSLLSVYLSLSPSQSLLPLSFSLSHSLHTLPVFHTVPKARSSMPRAGRCGLWLVTYSGVACGLRPVSCDL